MTFLMKSLEHLASVDLSELFNEAKTEYCRATRDLRRCGRYVKYVLNSCGHASLCAECCQRCDLCPICRIPLASGTNRLRLRLFDECIDAGLNSRRYGDIFQNKEDRDDQMSADIQRLCSFFDVSSENNLVSLNSVFTLTEKQQMLQIDAWMKLLFPVMQSLTALLLDEKVVKDWVKRNLSSILEVLESSFKGRPLAQLHDLHHLQESILKTKQHLEIIMWCMRHQFLEHVRSRHANFTSWHNLVRERKSAATARAWPDVVDRSANSTRQNGSLFIEELGEESYFAFLLKDSASFSRSKVEGLIGCYPFESLQAAVDILFLRGSSDLVVAKQAIESFQLLPEISGPTSHPKIARVLLERQNPEAAHIVLRWSGRDDGSQLVSLSEAVTLVWVKVECRLLTEAFIYQRMLCTKVRENNF
ncbi:hypothetical protein GOBAR_DD08553 [Gossypium barbadense]|nr:hypothetical protein GOBAR_DD08553 [Gossypium barbadense]